MGPTYNVETSRMALKHTKHNLWSKCPSKRAKVPNPSQAAKSEPFAPVKMVLKVIHSFTICPKAPHGSHIQCCNKQRRIEVHPNIQEEQTSFEEGQSAKPGPGSQIGAVCSRKRRQGTSIPSIYVQQLPMGPKYNVATGREELGYTISYWRSKRHSKRARMPNLI